MSLHQIRSCAFVLVVLAMSATASIAHAAPPKLAPPPPKPAGPSLPAPTEPTLADALTGDAKADYEAAKVYFTDKDYGRAYLKFQSAYERSKDARLLWNMAACQKEQRKYAKVVPLVEQYIKERGDKLAPAERDGADALLNAIKPGITSVKVDVSEPDAEIYLDDELIGKSPMTVGTLVDLGPHKLRVKKTLFDDFEQQMNAGGEAVNVLVKLTRTVHEGRVLVKAGTDDAISIDGAVVGQGVYSGKFPSGSHVLRVSAPGMRPYQGDVVIVDNETREIPVALDRAETKVIVPTWVWYTIAGAVIVAGGITATVVIINDNSANKTQYGGPHGSLGDVQLSRPPLGFHF